MVGPIFKSLQDFDELAEINFKWNQSIFFGTPQHGKDYLCSSIFLSRKFGKSTQSALVIIFSFETLCFLVGLDTDLLKLSLLLLSL